MIISRKLVLSLLVAIVSVGNLAAQPTCSKTFGEIFEQTATILNQKSAVDLWHTKLNAPLIIIDHVNNKMYLTAIIDGKVDPVKEEPWNNTVPLANSFSEYNGQNYVTIVQAALENASCDDRVKLLIHEIFHLHQNSVGIENATSSNFHLDADEGRALLRVELLALQKALQGNSEALHDALYIRKHRQSLFPQNNEDLFELNEGLAEYTAIKLALNKPTGFMERQLNYNIRRGYTNAFAYFTGPAYAFALDKLYADWRYDKDLQKGMPYLFAKSDSKYDIKIDKTYLNSLLKAYNYEQILAEENKEMQAFGDITAFENLLKSSTSKLVITNNGINFTFNPHDRVIGLTDAVLLRNMNLTGEWGTIAVKSGIVRLNNWSAFYLFPPTEVNGKTVKGNDYEITLNQGWQVIEKNKIWQFVKE